MGIFRVQGKTTLERLETVVRARGRARLQSSIERESGRVESGRRANAAGLVSGSVGCFGEARGRMGLMIATEA